MTACIPAAFSHKYTMGFVMVPMQVHDIVAGAIIAAEPRMSTELRMKVPHRNICFEVCEVVTARLTPT
jgi:hypothetical protein